MNERIHATRMQRAGRNRSLAGTILLVMAGLVVPSARVCGAQAESGSRLAFDAASVKPAAQCVQIFHPAPGHALGIALGSSFHPGGRYTGCASLKTFIMDAYQTEYALIAGGPEWVEKAQFQIDANAGRDADRDQMRTMLQSLLEERFGLIIHRQTKDEEAYALLVAEGGHKLQEAKDENGNPIVSMPSFEEKRKRLEAAMRGKDPLQAAQKIGDWMSGGGGYMELSSSPASMTSFAGMLRSHVGRSVIDKTGVAGLFDIRLRFADARARFQMSMGPGGTSAAALAPSSPSGPTIFEALQQQLGLKLEPAKVPLEYICIDSAEKPSEN